jgi:hypothetical protein
MVERGRINPNAVCCWELAGRTVEQTLVRWQSILGIVHLLFAMSFSVYCLFTSGGQ